MKHDIARCDVTPIGLNGCYRCRTGARFRFECKATFGSPLAEILCENGANWVSPCSSNGSETYTTLNFDQADIVTSCKVKCPAGETSFVMKGTLAFLIRSRPSYSVSGRGIEKASQLALPSTDISHLLWGLIGLPQITIIFLVVFVGIVILVLFVKLNPVFRGYRIVSRILLGLCALGLIPRIGAYDFANGLEKFSHDYGITILIAIISIIVVIVACLCFMIIEMICHYPPGRKISPRPSPPTWRTW